MFQMTDRIFWLLLITILFYSVQIIVLSNRFQESLEKMSLKQIELMEEELGPLSIRFAEKKQKSNKVDRSLKVLVFENLHRRPFIIFTNHYFYLNEQKKEKPRKILENVRL